MATEINFDGKLVTEPGSYTTTKSGIKNPPQSASYGNVLIIDTGTGASYGCGAGIAGTLKANKDAIQSFDNIAAFRSAVRGGKFWSLAKPLFQPKGPTIPGISKLHFVKAATTAPAEISYTFTGGGANGGVLVVQVRNEGLVGNGVEVSSVLTRGYACRIKISPADSTKFILDYYAGTFKGLDPDSEPYDGILEADCQPELLVSSIEFNTMAEITAWMKSDFTFNQIFKLKTSTPAGTGAITSADVSANTGNKLASGGTETYSTTHLDTVLNNVGEVDYTFILADKWGDNAQHADLVKILAHIVNEARYKKFMIVGGGKDRNKFTGSNGSIEIAEFYDTNRVIVVHGGYKKSIPTGNGFKEFDSIYKAAAVLGRIAGLEPQVPGTFKSIDMNGDLHDMNTSERKLALSKGVLHTKFDSEIGDFIINQAINSLQKNKNLVNEDGQSHDLAVERISAQLNKLIQINSKIQLFGQTEGVNRNTLSAIDVQQWLDGFLTLQEAKTGQDNLILSHENIVVETVGDAYKISYRYTPNFPVNKLLFTGFIIDSNVTIS